MPDTNDKPAMPLGAQILRKVRGSLNSLVAEVTKMAGGMDECEAKSVIGDLVGGMTTANADIEKHWGKFYKEHDLDAPEDEMETVERDFDEDEDEEDADDELDSALEALDGLSDDDEDAGAEADDGDEEEDDDDEEANLSPAERKALERRIKVLEAEEEHSRRLDRVAE